MPKTKVRPPEERLVIKEKPAPVTLPMATEEENQDEKGQESTSEDSPEKIPAPAPPAGAQKFCGKKKHWVPIENFAKRAASPDGLQSQCKECMNEYQKQYAAKKGVTPRAVKPQVPGLPNASVPTSLVLVDNTGLSDEDFEALSEEQGGKCACCRKNKHRTLDFDPDKGNHLGLLCIECNIAVAMVKHDEKLAKRLLRYVRSIPGYQEEDAEEVD